jgi:hypothetical protein
VLRPRYPAPAKVIAMRKRTIAISLSILAVAALAGGAYAASGSGSGPPQQRPFGLAEQTVIKDAANRLGVAPAKLTGALKQAFIDQIDAQIKAQHLPAAQAKAIKQKIEHAPGLPPFGPFLFGPGMIHAQVVAPGMMGAKVVAPGMMRAQVAAAPPFFAFPVVLPAAAKYLGLSHQQLLQQLKSGKTLAQIASAHGKSTSGLEQAIVTAFRSALARSVAASRAAEQHLLSGLTRDVQKLVNSKGPIGPLALAGKVQVPAGAAGPPFLGLLPPPVVRAWIAPQARAKRAP